MYDCACACVCACVYLRESVCVYDILCACMRACRAALYKCHAILLYVCARMQQKDMSPFFVDSRGLCDDNNMHKPCTCVLKISYNNYFANANLSSLSTGQCACVPKKYDIYIYRHALDEYCNFKVYIVCEPARLWCVSTSVIFGFYIYSNTK